MSRVMLKAESWLGLIPREVWEKFWDMYEAGGNREERDNMMKEEVAKARKEAKTLHEEWGTPGEDNGYRALTKYVLNRKEDCKLIRKRGPKTRVLYVASWPNDTISVGVCNNSLFDLFETIDMIASLTHVQKVWLRAVPTALAREWDKFSARVLGEMGYPLEPGTTLTWTENGAEIVESTDLD